MHLHHFTVMRVNKTGFFLPLSVPGCIILRVQRGVGVLAKPALSDFPGPIHSGAFFVFYIPRSILMSRIYHVIEAQQFDRALLSEIFAVAQEMEQVVQHYGSNILNRRVMATLFYEPSTRTRLSFESAMKRLGGDVITTESAQEFSSAAKGETLEDTIRVVSGYADIMVLRHFDSGASRRAAKVSGVPIINAR